MKRLKDILQQAGKDDLVRFLVGCFVLTSAGSLVLNLWRVPALGDDFTQWWENWLQAMSAQLFGAAILYLLVDFSLRRWAETQKTVQAAQSEKEKQDTRPIRTNDFGETPAQQVMNSYVARLKQATTREARQAILDEMKVGGVLPGATLNNLNLQGANFYDTDLRGISLEGCNLEGAYMIEANLQGANLNQANLQKAEMSWANLRGAFLGETNLQGAWLLQANLEESFLKTTHFDNQTRLPDGTRWTNEIAMQRFYDRHWPAFWRPDPGLFGELPRWYRREGVKS